MTKLMQLSTTILLVFSSLAFGHVSLESSFPTNGAMLMEAPKVLLLKFSKGVRLAKLSIKEQQGKKTDFGFTPSKIASNEFKWELPKLVPGIYNVEMIFLGKDGHKMKENFSFMLH